MNKKKPNISSLLLDWYDVNRRVLPWRENPSAYHVWLSEIMLQQTRVEAVKRYYERFLNYLPTINALAEADDDMLMKLWEGLGYYSRARNLKKAAKVVVDTYGGSLPKTKEELLKLPGIGEYTSSAISAIAYQQFEIAIDGNLIRVYARLTQDDADSKSEEMKNRARKYWLNQLKERPGDFNQALMDLGELVCLPNGTPKCEECPFSSICKAHQNGQELSYPRKSEKKAKRMELKTIFVIHYADKILLHRRPDQGLLASLYEFPNVPGRLLQEDAMNYLEKEGYVVASIDGKSEAKHIFTHLIWDMVGYEITVDDMPNLPSSFILSSKEDVLGRYSVPSAFKGFFALL